VTLEQLDEIIPVRVPHDPGQVVDGDIFPGRQDIGGTKDFDHQDVLAQRKPHILFELVGQIGTVYLESPGNRFDIDGFELTDSQRQQKLDHTVR